MENRTLGGTVCSLVGATYSSTQIDSECCSRRRDSPAPTLLIMNNRREWVGEGFRSHRALSAILAGALILFTYLGMDQLLGG